MTVQCFVDTNVLLYAVAGRLESSAKQKRAFALLDTLDFGVSAQVLQEFYVNALRKPEPRPTPDQVEEWMDWLSGRPFVDTDLALIRSAVALSRRYQITYWDAAILAAAERLGAPILYTEDLNDGQLYGAVLVENSFRGL